MRSRANSTRLILLKWHETMEVIWLIDHAGINGNHCRIHRIVRQFLDPDSMRWQMFSTSANCTGRTSSSQLPPTDTPKTNGCMETPAMAIGPIRDLRTWNNGMPQRPVVLCLACDSVSGRYCLKGLEKLGGGGNLNLHRWSWIARDQAKWGSWCWSAALVGFVTWSENWNWEVC